MTVPTTHHPGERDGFGGERPFKRLSPLTPLVRSFLLVLAFVGASWHSVVNGQLGVFAIVLGIVLVAGAIYGYASWLRTKYWIEGDELRVDTGIVSRQSRRIRVDRLQAIDIVQPLAARLFGLAELKMDVAGGGRAEGSLAFLPLAEAVELRAQLLARRDDVHARPTGDTRPAPDPRSRVPGPMPERRLVSLDIRMLVTSILLSGHTGGFVVSAIVTVVIYATTGQFSGVASMLPIVGGFALAITRRVIAFYGFTVSETPAGIQIRRGLIELSTQTVALPRVQGVRITEPLLWRPLGWARLDVSVAGARSEHEDRPSAWTVMPVAPRSVVLWLARFMLAGSPGADLHPDDVPLTPPPRRARWIAPIRRSYMSAGIRSGTVVSCEGVITRRTNIVPLARIQSVHLEQGLWQRALHLAGTHVDSPPGPVRVRAEHWDEHAARELLEEIGARARRARLPVGAQPVIARAVGSPPPS